MYVGDMTLESSKARYSLPRTYPRPLSLLSTFVCYTRSAVCSLQAGEACLYQTIVVLGKQWYERSLGLDVLLKSSYRLSILFSVTLSDYVSNDVERNMHS